MNLLARYVKNTLAGLVGPWQVMFEQFTLLRLLYRREIAMRTSGTVFGFVWLVIQPALQVAALWFLLDFVLHVKFPGQVPFLDYFLTGMVPWLLIAEVLNRNLSVLSEFGALYQRTAFPLKILPLLPLLLPSVIYGAIYFAVTGLLVGPIAAVLTVPLTFGILLWLSPFCYLLSVLGLFVKDVRQFFPFLLTMMMYVTPILYMPAMLPDTLRPWLVVNPFADLMAIGHGVLQGMPVSSGNWVRPLSLWLVSLAPAWVLYRRAEPHMRELL